MKDNKMQITKNESLSKVDEMFCELKNKKKFALMPFIMAGDPNIEITSEILLKLQENGCLLYTSPSPRDALTSRMPSSA